MGLASMSSMSTNHGHTPSPPKTMRRVGATMHGTNRPVTGTTRAHRPAHPRGSLIYMGPAAVTPPNKPPSDAAGPPLVTEGVRVPSQPVTRGLYSAKHYFPTTARGKDFWPGALRHSVANNFFPAMKTSMLLIYRGCAGVACDLWSGSTAWPWV